MPFVEGVVDDRERDHARSTTPALNVTVGDRVPRPARPSGVQSAATERARCGSALTVRAPARRTGAAERDDDRGAALGAVRRRDGDGRRRESLSAIVRRRSDGDADRVAGAGDERERHRLGALDGGVVDTAYVITTSTTRR